MEADYQPRRREQNVSIDQDPARFEEQTKGKPLVLKVHEARSFEWKFGDDFGYQLNGARGPKNHLPAGTYTLTASKTMEGATKNVEVAKLPPLWVGEVV